MQYFLDTNTTVGDTTIQTIISNKKPKEDEERQIKVHLSAIDNAHEKIKLDIIELNKLFELNKARFNLISPILDALPYTISYLLQNLASV